MSDSDLVSGHNTDQDDVDKDIDDQDDDDVVDDDDEGSTTSQSEDEEIE